MKRDVTPKSTPRQAVTPRRVAAATAGYPTPVPMKAKSDGPRPALMTIPGVELVAAGTWYASTGKVTFTREHLASAVAAYGDPAVRKPVIKLGHVDPNFNAARDDGQYDGKPAVGRIENLRLSADGMTLIGDFVGMPAWLAEVLPYAYPSRSIEGLFNAETAAGGRHEFLLTGIALLGESEPAVKSLDDIHDLFYGLPDTTPE